MTGGHRGQLEAGVVAGLPGRLLRLEGLALLVFAVTAYAMIGRSWWLFAGLLLTPDLAAMMGGFGTRAAAVVYDTFHTTALPLLASAAAWMMSWRLVLAMAVIWLAHIGMDRVAGYGLRYEHRFELTHLGVKGRGGSLSSASMD